MLPCQGFWNGLIYITTTLPACKQFYYSIQNRIRVLFGKKPIDRRRPIRIRHDMPRGDHNRSSGMGGGMGAGNGGAGRDDDYDIKKISDNTYKSRIINDPDQLGEELSSMDSIPRT